MLLNEIVEANQFAWDIVMAIGTTHREPPRTPKPVPRMKPAATELTPLHVRRAREKQSHRGGTGTRGANTAMPSCGHVQS
uniref:Uncharacterized protein n=1 Tax=Zea mays TaxID=4577 RepID=A0A804R6L2_MAIZE